MTICVLCFRLIFPPISLDPLVFFFMGDRGSGFAIKPPTLGMLGFG